MDDLQEAIQTVTKMSPPMLVIVGGAIVNFLLKPFLPEKYLAPIATVGGAAVSPWLFSPGNLAYDVPSPATGLAIIGGIMGFVGSVFHRRIDRWLRNKVMGTTQIDVSTNDPRARQDAGRSPD